MPLQIKFMPFMPFVLPVSLLASTNCNRWARHPQRAQQSLAGPNSTMKQTATSEHDIPTCLSDQIGALLACKTAVWGSDRWAKASPVRPPKHTNRQMKQSHPPL
jgi:hypothetical protein